MASRLCAWDSPERPSPNPLPRTASPDRLRRKPRVLAGDNNYANIGNFLLDFHNSAPRSGQVRDKHHVGRKDQKRPDSPGCH